MTFQTKSFRTAVLLGVLLTTPVAPPAVAAGPSEDQATAFAETRGRLIFELDRAAWVATDDMMAKVPRWRDAGMKGYVVEQAAEDFTVTFYGGSGEAPVAFYSARIENRKVVSREVYPAAARPPLTAGQKRLVAIRTAAQREAAGKPICAKAAFNITIIPPAAADAASDIYLTTPQVKPKEYPFGGHYRATVAPDGRITGSRAFTKSCITMAQPKNVTALVISHLLDPVPTEIHVFTSLSAGLPVYVAIPESNRVFAVAGDKIRLVQD
jgi:hypothetical protein